MSELRQIKLQEATWKDDRGWGLDIFKAINLTSKFFGNIHIVSMKPGTIRGNHYHSKATEWLLVCGGQAIIAWRPTTNDDVQEIIVSDPEPSLFEIPPNVEHAIMNNSYQEIFLISFNDCSARGTVRCPSLFKLKKDNFIFENSHV